MTIFSGCHWFTVAVCASNDFVIIFLKRLEIIRAYRHSGKPVSVGPIHKNLLRGQVKSKLTVQLNFQVDICFILAELFIRRTLSNYPQVIIIVLV